jgi:hypothetical protein
VTATIAEATMWRTQTEVHVAEEWSTVEEIAAARERFEAAIPGWVRPQAYALGLAPSTEPGAGEILFPKVNVDEHYLPAVVLATVCGHAHGTAAYRLSPEELDEAIALLAPAEACAAYDHPNLAGWRRIRQELVGGGQPVAVFLDALADLSTDLDVAQLREQVAIRGAT